MGQVSEICVEQDHRLSQQRPPSDYEKFNYINQSACCNFLDDYFSFLGHVFISK